MPTLLRPKKTDVIIHPIFTRDKIEGQLIIRSDAHKKKKTEQGLVIALGKEAEEKSGLEIADHVVYNAYAGSHISIEDGGWFHVLHWRAIEGIIKPSDVILLDTETAKKIIQDRLSEMSMKYQDDPSRQSLISEIEASLLDRIDNFIINEGFQWGGF